MKETKRCGVCEEHKTLDNFYQSDTGKIQSRCKPCCVRLNGERRKSIKASLKFEPIPDEKVLTDNYNGWF